MTESKTIAATIPCVSTLSDGADHQISETGSGPAARRYCPDDANGDGDSRAREEDGRLTENSASRKTIPLRGAEERSC